MTRTCANQGCGKQFTPSCAHHFFCCEKCRKQARGKDWGWVRLAALERDEYTCQECGKQNCRLEVHHVVFVCHGGTSTLDNTQTLCVPCHKQKHREWRG